MIDALYCRSTAVLLAMHVWLYVVAVLYMVSGAGRPRSAAVAQLGLRRTWRPGPLVARPHTEASVPRALPTERL